ncbi:MAG: hypothetical protein UY08_C0015G0010 [Candidatus Gottesmanbacteria bacterium GW2011_GWA1_47_8]|uniref:Uncharacterized protein n=1 Tax=Candidatus Gottesmanbacteria bacterium GW2011_GWA1_47_8 TaxID=1618438 RepID=A0A0G1VR33_9BACT|nr:MAG: hypothetical protein UY08_C0015G0010 [Candidatus Gottesmanbacteria bacterium GW2011_GWA1_47_8]
MLKKLIAPIQAIMLKKGRCVGCGAALDIGKKAKYNQNQTKITCACGRHYSKKFNGEANRALLFHLSGRGGCRLDFL